MSIGDLARLVSDLEKRVEVLEAERHAIQPLKEPIEVIGRWVKENVNTVGAGIE